MVLIEKGMSYAEYSVLALEEAGANVAESGVCYYIYDVCGVVVQAGMSYLDVMLKLAGVA